MALFEIRQYQVYPGKMDACIEFMETRVAPFTIARCMVIPAMIRGEEDENLQIWIRRFNDEAHREKLYKAVYDSEEWQMNYKPTIYF
ncbi:MAG: NIPSNAP family containing protein [Pseudomonadota bacterium]